jgi:hypothetical protein
MREDRLRTAPIGAAIVAWAVSSAASTVLVTTAAVLGSVGEEWTIPPAMIFVWSIFSTLIICAPGGLVFGGLLGRFIKKSLLVGKEERILRKQVLTASALLGLGYGFLVGVVGVEGFSIVLTTLIGGVAGVLSGIASIRVVRADFLHDLAANRAV